MTDSRAEFEAWFNNDDGRCCEPSGYESPHVAALWSSWQAARKAALAEAEAICDDLATMMEQGAGELAPGGRLRQAARSIRSLADRSPT